MSIMSKGLITAAVLAGIFGVLPQAHATLQFTADNNGAQSFAQDQNTTLGLNGVTIIDGDPTPGNLLLGNGIAVNVGGGIFVSGSATTSTNPATGIQILNSSSLSVFNTNAFAVTATVAVSATGFNGPVTSYAASGSGTFQNAVGATMINRWYDDPTNGQGAQANTCAPGNTCSSPGILLNTSPLFTDDGSPNSYSFNFTGPVTDTGPFSMTLQFEFTLPGFAAGSGCSATNLSACPGLTSRGQALQKTNTVPEPASLGLLGVGLVGIGMLRRRFRR